MMRPDPSTLFSLFPVDERARVESGALRYAMLVGSAKEAIYERMKAIVGPTMAERWGEPATHTNPIPAVARALSRPGHYGEAPTIVGDQADPIRVAMAPFWPMLQYGEFVAFGIGSAWRYVEAIPEDVHPDPADPERAGGCSVRIVPHHELWCTPSPRDASAPMIVRWLRLRRVGDEERAAWDIWDLSDPMSPAYLVRLAEAGGKLGAAIPGLDMVGDAYPWRTPSGAPFMPWSCQRRDESGDLHNWHLGRDEPSAAVATIITETMVRAVARQSTGRIAIVAGLQLSQVATRAMGDGSIVQVIDAQPGDILMGTREPGGDSPFVAEVGGSEHLEALSAEAIRQASRTSAMMGVMPSDATRVGANPMSGIAIHLSNAAKRDEQRRTTPLAARADMATIRHVAWCLGWDPGAFAIAYTEIRASPDEEREQRESDEWEVAQGLASIVDVYQRRNPGLTREEAITQLRRIREDERQINAAVAAGGTDNAQ